VLVVTFRAHRDPPQGGGGGTNGLTTPPTVVIRHWRERKSKCSLQPLVGRPDLIFRTYRRGRVDLGGLPDLSSYVRLDPVGPPLDPKGDAEVGLLVLDGTWRYVAKMTRLVHAVSPRSLPGRWLTAYPRRQPDAPTEAGLASVEALFIATHLLGRDTRGLLDGYHWRDEFLALNPALTRDV
jgi:pre-rRNA-processing protein TSR3